MVSQLASMAAVGAIGDSTDRQIKAVVLYVTALVLRVKLTQRTVYGASIPTTWKGRVAFLATFRAPIAKSMQRTVCGALMGIILMESSV